VKFPRTFLGVRMDSRKEELWLPSKK
jgi:hypothetical protein